MPRHRSRRRPMQRDTWSVEMHLAREDICGGGRPVECADWGGLPGLWVHANSAPQTSVVELYKRRLRRLFFFYKKRCITIHVYLSLACA
jgi:hypothetical protein